MAKFVRSNLSDQIFDYLKEQITSGAWKAGEKIPSETELSADLGVSRMSLRTAIKKANTLGLTETRVGEGTFVREFNMGTYMKELYSANLLKWDSNDLNDLRYLLQLGSIEFAFERGITETEMQELDVCYARLSRLADENNMQEFHEADTEFHRIICHISHNTLLIMIYDAISTLLDHIIKQNVEESVKVNGSLQYVIGHHRDLYEGIKERNLEHCRKALDESRGRSRLYYK